jgi:ABC-2 type transport system permease protein
MNTILNTALVVVKNFVRNRRSFRMRLLFPIVLILVLSSAFSKSFNQTLDFSGGKVLCSQDGGAASTVLNEFMKSAADQLGLEFVQADDPSKAVDDIKNNKAVAYIAAEDTKLTFYRNSNPSYNFEAEVIEPMLKAFAMRFGTVMAVSSLDPAAVKTMAGSEIKSYTNLVSVNLHPQSAMDYYAVVIFLMITLTGAMTGANAVRSDMIFRTGQRLKASPASPYQVFTGRVLGSVAVNCLFALTLIAISSMMGANWGGNTGMTLLITVTAVIFAQAFGVALAMFVKNDSTISSVITFGSQILAFFGGSYFPVSNFSGMLKTLSNLSPIKWASQGIFDSIAQVPGNSALIAVIINLAAAALLLLVSTFKLNRERELS